MNAVEQATLDRVQYEYYRRTNLPLGTTEQYRRACKLKMFWTPWRGFWFVLAWVMVAAGIFLAVVPL